MKFILLAVLFSVACTVDHEYVYVQTEDGLGMKAPITHVVRIKVDTSKKTVTWLDDYSDANGIHNREQRTYGGGPADFTSCEFFDVTNWGCVMKSTAGEVIESPMMQDGRLTRVYWGQVERYDTRRKFRSLY